MSELVETTIQIRGTDAAAVWSLLRDIERYPEFMPGVRSSRILERRDRVTRSSWASVLNGNEMLWTQEDVEIETADGTLLSEFAQLEGDIEVWRGRTSVRPLGDMAVEVTYRIEFDLGIPAMADVLHPVASRAIRANCQEMLEAIKAQCERKAIVP